MTPLGEQAACEFGSCLSKNFNYRVFHSPAPRCKNTAAQINQRIKDNNGISEVKGILHYIAEFLFNEEKCNVYIKRDKSHFLTNWISGFYPSDAATPTITVAQKTSHNIIENGSLSIWCTPILIKNVTNRQID